MTLRHQLEKARQITHSNNDSGTLLDNLQHLIDSAEEFLESTASYGGAEIEAARAKVAAQLSAARQYDGRHRRARANHRAKELETSPGQAVREHKWEAEGIIAAGAALILGVYAG